MPVVTYQINSSKGDAREDTAGVVAYSYTDLLFGNSRRYQFMRFINVNIPQGAVINSAYVKLTSRPSKYKGGTPTITFYAEKNVDPQELSSINLAATSEISSRIKTTNSVAWANPAFNAPNTQYTSPDLKSIIQEIVNQGGWSSGRAINIITDMGASSEGNWVDTWAFDGSPAKSAILEIDYNVPSEGLIESGKQKQKQFWHKIYDTNGNYLATLANDVINKPEFSWKMNGGMGEMVIDYKKNFNNFGEGTIIKHGNIVKTYIQDGDQERGKKIWEGKINKYQPIKNNEGTEIIQITATSRLLEMQYRIVRNAGDNTTITYSSQDPTNIFKSLINSTAAGGILKVGQIFNNTSTSVTFKFECNTFVDAFDDIIKISPQYWYWWLNAENEINFKLANFEEIQHYLTIGKEIIGVSLGKSIEEMINRIYFLGGGSPALFKKYDRASSQTEYGLREYLIKDERVTVAATAQIIADSYFNNYDHPVSEIEIEVIDNNIDPVNGYNIEQLKPGDIVKIIDPRASSGYTLWDEAYWDVDYWDYSIQNSLGIPVQIIEIQYQFNKAILKLSTKMESMEKRIEDIQRNLNKTAQSGMPTVPS